MKTTRKILPALAMLLVSAIMLSTASYAWFASNSTVKATGMSVKVKANTYYLEITTPELLDAAGENVDSAFSSFVDLTNEETKAIELVHAMFGTPDTPSDDPADLNWYVGTSDTTGNKGGLGENPTPIATDNGVDGKYVLYNQVVVRLSPTSDTSLANLKLATGEGGVKVALKETNNNNPMKAALRLLAVAYDGEEVKGAQIYNFGTGAISGSESLLSEVATGAKQYKIDLYLYFDGQDDTAFTDNAINLDEYVVDVAFSASTPSGT